VETQLRQLSRKKGSSGGDWAVMVRDWNRVGKWLNRVWEREANKDRKWDRKCFDVFYEGLVDSEKSAWVASRVQGTELAEDILGHIVRFYKGESGPKPKEDRTIMVVRKKAGDKVVRRESFESLHEVRVPEDEEEKSKKPRKVSRKEKEEESDLEDDVKDVAVVQRDTGPMDHVVATLADITKMLKGREAQGAEEQQLRSAKRAEVGVHGEQGRGPAGDAGRGHGQGQWGWGRGGGRGQWPAAGRGQGQWGSNGPPQGQWGQGQWGSNEMGSMLEGRDPGSTFFREMLFDKGYEVCSLKECPAEKEEASGGRKTDPGAGTEEIHTISQHKNEQTFMMTIRPDLKWVLVNFTQ
jgi:hypothetical protein